MRGVYLLHFEPRYRHAQHYIGYASDVGPRVHAHVNRVGATLTRVAIEAGCTITLARVWEEGDRTLEKKLKARHGAARFCPICKGEKIDAV